MRLTYHAPVRKARVSAEPNDELRNRTVSRHVVLVRCRAVSQPEERMRAVALVDAFVVVVFPARVLERAQGVEART